MGLVRCLSPTQGIEIIFRAVLVFENSFLEQIWGIVPLAAVMDFIFNNNKRNMKALQLGPKLTITTKIKLKDINVLKYQNYPASPNPAP